MTTLSLHLPDALAQRIQQAGILESKELLKLLEAMTEEFEKQQTREVVSILDKLAAPEIEGLADVDFDVPKAQIETQKIEW